MLDSLAPPAVGTPPEAEIPNLSDEPARPLKGAAG